MKSLFVVIRKNKRKCLLSWSQILRCLLWLHKTRKSKMYHKHWWKCNQYPYKQYPCNNSKSHALPILPIFHSLTSQQFLGHYIIRCALTRGQSLHRYMQWNQLAIPQLSANQDCLFLVYCTRLCKWKHKRRIPTGAFMIRNLEESSKSGRKGEKRGKLPPLDIQLGLQGLLQLLEASAYLWHTNTTCRYFWHNATPL